MSKIVYLTRRETFSAAHTLNNKNLSVEENKEIFSKCNNCHGHNYTVEVTVKGPVDPVTGMDILDQLDHKNLDVDVEYFKEVVSTTENLTIFIWDQLEQKLIGQSCSLHEIKIFETEKNICIYRGESR